MALVSLGLRPSLHAAAQACDGLKVSMQTLDEKVHHTEPRVVRELVRGSGERLLQVLEQLKLQQPSWAEGIGDSKALSAAVEHRGDVRAAGVSVEK
jgi:hypothetical protein